MTLLAGLAAIIWVYLLIGHGKFWQSGPVMAPQTPASLPRVAIIVPARDEADHIAQVLHALLAQDYAGPFSVILVDDESADETGIIANQITDPRLTVIKGAERKLGWAGKLWAVAQGIEAAGDADYLFLTDADIVHDPRHLSTLVAHATTYHCGLVSEMVQLSTASQAERALVPAFVYFFAMLYPFAWVNDPASATAAAAGGSMLVEKAALTRAGGIAVIRDALIDDVALARALKPQTRIYLGHSTLARSIRPYDTVEDIWRMIARSAYVQLRYSPLLLAGTFLGMILIWLVPPVAMIFGHGLGFVFGTVTTIAACTSYIPTLKRFNLSPLWAAVLPATAMFYLGATISSAVDHYQGTGVQWKRRSYTP